jgi:riboflavin biosynthesis pyrimidine reductase
MGTRSARIVWYTAMSMDGRLATADNDLGFLDTIGDRGDAGRGEWDAFVAEIDGVIIGATTLRWLLDGGHSWPHDDLPTWLVSHDTSLPARVGPTRAPLHRVEGDLTGMLDQIEAAGLSRVWLCGGGAVAGQLLALDAVDEVIATVAPTALGNGPALFEHQNLSLPRFGLVECRPAGGDAARLVWHRRDT